MERFTEAEAFTPCELSAPNPRVCRAVIARLERLLQKHYPDIFPTWVQRMEEKGLGRAVNLYWLQTLAYLAAAVAFDHRRGYETEERSPPDEARLERRLALLSRLVAKGCKKRGEFLTPAEREERLEAQEAVYRERYGDAAYHRMIEDKEQPGQEQQEAA